jgi:hypothetical protein
MGIPLMNQHKKKMQDLMMICSNQSIFRVQHISLYGEGITSVIALLIDEDSIPYLSYDVDDDEDVIVPQQGLEDQLLVKEKKIVQVLTRADGITSSQLRIIKEALEKMKVYYLQLFMDRDLTLKFIEDKEREIEDLCYLLSMAHSSSLKTSEVISSLKTVMHEIMSDTHDLRKDPLVMIPHKEQSELQVYEERLDTQGLGHALVFHCRDHEPFLLDQILATYMVVEKIPYG